MVAVVALGILERHWRRRTCQLSREPVPSSKNDHEHRVGGYMITFSERLSARGQVREDIRGEADLTGDAACQVCQVAEPQGQPENGVGKPRAAERNFKTFSKARGKGWVEGRRGVPGLSDCCSLLLTTCFPAQPLLVSFPCQCPRLHSSGLLVDSVNTH